MSATATAPTTLMVATQRQSRTPTRNRAFLVRGDGLVSLDVKGSRGVSAAPRWLKAENAARTMLDRLNWSDVVFEHMYDAVMGQRRHDKALPSLSRSGPPPVKHVWVRNPSGYDGTFPRLIVEWRNDAGGWLARVVFVVPSSHTDVVIERWLLPERLTPNPGMPPA